ncbi:Major facilitator, sugar transporter-like [Sesbania bispinosa]|nr:Major facilitator, sugar transporter-like [Sesbania bispinosa]
MAPAKLEEHSSNFNVHLRFLCPETPNSLVEQNRIEEGRMVLEKIRGTPNVDAEFDDLIEASREGKSIKNPFKNLLLRKNRPRLIIGALAIPAFQQLTGNNSILFYAPVAMAIALDLEFGKDKQLPLRVGELFPLEIRSAAQSVVCVST